MCLKESAAICGKVFASVVGGRGYDFYGLLQEAKYFSL
jgi:hypothetical protein